jgi:hypothetical protein
MTLTRLVLAASVLLAFASPADDLGFHPKSDHEIKKDLKIDLELKTDKVEITVNGESTPPDEMGFEDEATKVALRVSATDKYVQAKDGRPTDLLRTFDSLRLSYETGDKKEDAPKFDALEGKTVRFKWNADTEAYEKSLKDGKGDDALLDPLSEDMDVRLLLPPKKVAEGDSWDVPGQRLLPLFLPGGLPGPVGTAEDKEQVQTFLEELRSSFAKLQDDLKVHCKYKGSKEDGGAKVAEIEFHFTTSGKADISHLIETLLSMEEDGIHPDAEANADVEVSGDGVLLWDLAEGRVHSLSMDGEAGIDLDVKTRFAIEGEDISMNAKVKLGVKTGTKLETSKP